MTARNTKGLKISVVKPDATPVSETITGATAGKPTTIQVADTTGFAVGDMIKVAPGATGLASVDGKWHVITAVASPGTTAFSIDADSTGGTVALGGTPTFSYYASATALQGICWSELTLNVDEPDTQSVATYCDPTATISSAATSAGSLSFAGFVDIKDADYAMLLDLVDNGNHTAIRIDLPGNGYLFAPVTFSSITWDLPLDGAIGYSGSATLSSKMVHAFV